MDLGYPILMFCFSAALLLYGIVLMTSKKISLIPVADRKRIRNPRAFAAQYGKAAVILSLSPTISGILWMSGAVRRSVVLLVLSFLLCLWEGTELVGKVEEE